MNEEISLDDFGKMIAAAAAAIRENSAMLCELDCVAGDGDHGLTMLRVVDCLEQVFAANRPASLKAGLQQAGWQVLGVDGGASSSLLGVLFAGMANSPACSELSGAGGLAALFNAGLTALRKQTKAQPGDKTMLDALVPAVTALHVAGERRKSVLEALRSAADAARQGAEATRTLSARYGRARLLGEKTRGHIDPGAASISLLFEGFYRGFSEER